MEKKTPPEEAGFSALNQQPIGSFIELMGRLVYSSNHSVDQDFEVNLLDGFENGIYIFTVTNDGIEFIRKKVCKE